MIIKQKTKATIKPTLLAMAIAQAVSMSGVDAAIISVTSSGDNPNFGCTLREAITSMNVGNVLSTGCSALVFEPFGTADKIIIPPGISTITLSSGALDINKDLVIQGSDTTINGDGSNRIMTLDEANTIIELTGLVMVGGNPAYIPGMVGSDRGGAILAKDTTLTLSNCTISGNTSTSEGGGIYARRGYTNIIDSTISGNLATIASGSTKLGGGIAMVSGSLNMSNSMVSNNFSLDHGGGIYAGLGADVTVSDSVISGNSSDKEGGGIHLNYNGTTVTLNGSTVSGNSSNTRGGGGIFVKDRSTLAVQNNSFISNNYAKSSGGGLLVEDGNSITVSESTISGNTSNGNGGGIYTARNNFFIISKSSIYGNLASSGGGIQTRNVSDMDIVNSTVSGNTSRTGTGGIDARFGSSVTLINSTVANNYSDSMNDANGITVEFGGLIALQNSIVANSNPLGGVDCKILPLGPPLTSSVTATQFSIIQDGSCGTNAFSGDPKLGLLEDNGGPTKTHSLLRGSPAIDAGDAAVCAAPPVNGLDQRGETRPMGSRCDIGAFETEDNTQLFVVPLKNGKAAVFEL